MLDQITEFNSRTTPRIPPTLERAAELVLRASGEDVTREGLLRTPHRFATAMRALTIGYDQTPEKVIGEGIFAAEGPGLVSVRDVEFYSLCEHHLLPFWGSASVAYYPAQQILGLSKVPRLIELYARRFQVQERLTRQVAEAIEMTIHPRAVVVRVKACHLCMMMRGVEKQGSDTVTEFQIGLKSLDPIEKDRIFKSLES